MHNSTFVDSVVAELSRLESRLFLLSPPLTHPTSLPPLSPFKPSFSLVPTARCSSFGTPPLFRYHFRNLLPTAGAAVEENGYALAATVRRTYDTLPSGKESRINYEQKRTLASERGVEEPLLRSSRSGRVQPASPVRDDGDAAFLPRAHLAAQILPTNTYTLLLPAVATVAHGQTTALRRRRGALPRQWGSQRRYLLAPSGTSEWSECKYVLNSAR